MIMAPSLESYAVTERRLWPHNMLPARLHHHACGSGVLGWLDLRDSAHVTRPRTDEQLPNQDNTGYLVINLPCMSAAIAMAVLKVFRMPRAPYT